MCLASVVSDIDNHKQPPPTPLPPLSHRGARSKVCLECVNSGLCCRLAQQTVPVKHASVETAARPPELLRHGNLAVRPAVLVDLPV